MLHPGRRQHLRGAADLNGAHLVRPRGTPDPARSGARGTAAARSALPLLRHGVDSAPECLLRLLIVGAGLPEPDVNRWIVDRDGRRISRPDLHYRERRIAMEYEGEHHLTDPRQWSRDIERDERLRALGWTVLRFTKAHLGVGGEEALARIRRALDSSAGREDRKYR